MSITSITILLLFFFIFLFIGIKFSKISKPKEFLLMGRNIGFWLFFGAYTGASIGGASTAGFVGYGFEQGFSSMWLIAVSGITLPLFAFVFAKKLNVFGRINEAYTLPDFLAVRFGERIRGLSSFISYLRPVFISGLQFVALGIVFKVAFNISIKYGILISAVLILVYTVSGGQYSAITAQWIQSILQGAGLLIFLIAAIYYNGGLKASFSNLHKFLSPEKLSAYSTDFSVFTVWIITMGLFYLVDPWLYQWAYMAKNAQTSFDAMVAVSLSSPWGAISFMGGMLIEAATKAKLITLPASIQGDQVYLYFITKIINPTIGIFLLVSFIMTVLSCASSFLLNGATLLYNDFLKNTKISQKANQIKLSRLSVLITTVFGIATALWVPFLIPLWIIGQGLAVSGLLVPVFAAWFWKRGTSKAAYYSLISGLLTSFLYSIYAWIKKGSPNAIVNGFHFVHIGLIVSFVFMIIVSYMDKKEPDEIVNKTLWTKIPWE